MIEYPVKLTEDFQIVDRFNRTVIPDLTWKGDLSHRHEQKGIGELIVNLLNAHASSHEEILPEPTKELIEAGEVRRGRGRPRKYA